MRKLKRVGWIGFSDDKPFFETVTDDYTKLHEAGFQATNVFKDKKEAQKRFQDIRKVFILK